MTKFTSTKLKKLTYIIYIGVICVWCIAWIMKVYIIDSSSLWFTTSPGSFVWWTTAKIFIWILPAYYLIKISGRKQREIFNTSNFKNIILWGGGIGFLIALTGFVPKYFSEQTLLPSEISFPLLNVLIIAPIFEEFIIRGAILGNLQRIHTFWTANVISSLMFIGLHIPGWYFMGSLAENLAKPTGGALSIFFLGLLFGYAVKRSQSVVGGMLAHFLNNFSSLH